MESSRPASQPIEEIMEGFLAARRRGERPSIDRCVHAHPEHGERLRRLLAAMLELETASEQDELALREEPALPQRMGDFEILAEIGRGGMGVVYEATQLSLGRRVALKVLPATKALDPRRRERFDREARAAARLHHSHIVPVFAIGEHDGTHFFAMQRIEGRPLHEVIRELRRRRDGVEEVVAPAADGAPSLLTLRWATRGWFEAAARLAVQVADALAYAHRQGVLHRDIKPANLLLGDDDWMWITDFGLAQSADSDGLTRSGDVVGTLPYLAPERLRGESDERSDVYGLGLTLHELVTLRPVGPECAPSATSPRDWPTPPADLAAIIAKARAAEPARRYQSAADLADDLQRFLHGLPVCARRSGSVDRGRRWARRHPAATALAIVCCLALALGIAGAIWHVVRMDAALGAYHRMADVELLRRLDAEARDELWPARPERVAQMDAWLRRAEALVGRAAVHARTLHEIASSDTDGSRTEIEWQQDVLTTLVRDIAALATHTVPLVKARRDHAASVEARTVSGAEAAGAWASARAAIEADPRYGFDLPPQLGLLPLGPDPSSGLFEFAHLLSGKVPERDRDGHLRATGDTCLVLVLIPGGTFRMGAQAEDEAGPNFDPAARRDERPVDEVALDPFLLSKWEMTQGQWRRITGSNPSAWFPDHPLFKTSAQHPVEQVSWRDAQRVLGHLELELPTEAQWEYAARAGTTTPWHSGRDAGTLQLAGNLADATYREVGPGTLRYEAWRDGYVVTAPVGCFAANGFGLYDTVGNVWEWCRDGYRESYAVRAAPGDGLRDAEAHYFRVTRGGGWNRDAVGARSAYRDMTTEDGATDDCGVRPACRLRR